MSNFLSSVTQRKGSMDDLAHILTDPLGTREESNGQITEDCMLGNCRVSLPEDLLEDVSYSSSNYFVELVSH